MPEAGVQAGERSRAGPREEPPRRGRLTIYFGAAPGVGKTFTMLQEACFARDVENRDVVAGVVETHGRFETATLLAGLERLPPKRLDHDGESVEELDLDAALARKPSVVLVDDLAHANAPGGRHKKRWQDVEELLGAGIDVMTTLNVQHVESLKDVVEQITGIVVHETVPDSVIDSADEMKLVDLPPDELLGRLREGKVHLPARAEQAVEGLFRKGNLIALRELALRKTAERVDADMQAWRHAHGIKSPWAAAERLLVCVSPSPHSRALLRVGRRMAAGLHAEWLAVNVETPATLRLPREDRLRISAHLTLAEQLGAEAITLTGERAADAILELARERNVTKIVVGKQRELRWLDGFRTSFVDELIAGSGDIDVYVTAGEPEEPGPAPPQRAHSPQRAPVRVASYLVAVLMVAVATAVAGTVFGRAMLTDVVMTYLLGIVLLSMRAPFRVAIVGAVLSVLAFNFFFIPPYLTFSVVDLRHIVTFAVMLLVAVVIPSLTQRVKDQVELARQSERRTSILYSLSRDLAEAFDLRAQARAACRHFAEVFDADVAVFAAEEGGELGVLCASSGFEPSLDREADVVRWVEAQRKEAGIGTDSLPSSPGYYLPLATPGGASLGVLGLYARDPGRFEEREQRELAQGLATQVALAMERATLAEETRKARLRAEAEQVRSTLLSSVSHDLRTPLAVMKGTASAMAEDDAALTPAARSELVQALMVETERLERMVSNLLDMTRLESGAVRSKKEWQPAEELVGGALRRADRLLEGRAVRVDVPAELLVLCDGALAEQALVNLLENAAKHTPAGSPIEISAEAGPHETVLAVSDRGPGLSKGDERRVFEKFHRGSGRQPAPGFGLGLAICRAIASVHGGRIWAENRAGGGASFKLAFPLEGKPAADRLPEMADKGG